MELRQEPMAKGEQTAYNRVVNLDLPAVTKAYRRWARVYNFYFGWIFHPGRLTALELIDCQPGKRILEVGVGTGLSLPLYPRHVRVVGIDISPEMLSRAQELKDEEGLEQVEALEVMNAEEMSFADSSFDTVVAMYVTTVVPSRKKFVEEMKRVCKPGGRIIILNHFYKPWTVKGRLSALFAPLSKQLGFRPNLSLDEFLSETGIKISNKISVNLFDMWTILIATNEK